MLYFDSERARLFLLLRTLLRVDAFIELPPAQLSTHQMRLIERCDTTLNTEVPLVNPLTLYQGGVTMKDLRHLAFVGMDIHKDQHTTCVIDCFGRSLATFDIRNDPNYFKELTSRVNMISSQNNLKPVFGLEDTQYFGQRLARFLITTGNYIKEIPPVKTERKRSHCAHRDKSDPEDALAIAKVLIQDFDRLQTVNTFDELHLAIRELSNQREA